MNSESPPKRINLNCHACTKLKADLFRTPAKVSSSKKINSSSQKKYYEKSCCGHINLSQYNLFLSELQKEIKRIDISFSLSGDKKMIFQSILAAVKKSVDSILTLKKNIRQSECRQQESQKQELENYQADLVVREDKLKSLAKQLDDYNSMLKLKEEEIKLNEKECLDKRSSIMKEELSSEEIRLNCIKLEREIKELKSQRSEKNLNDSLISELESLQKENFKLKDIIAGNRSIDNIEDSIDNLDRDISEKYNTDTSDKKNIKKRDFNSEGCEVDANEEHFDSNILKEIEGRYSLLVQRESELNENILAIKEQIDIYNTELEIKEKIIDDQIAKNLSKESLLNKKIIDLKIIEDILIGSVLDIEKFNNFVVLRFEKYSQASCQILADLFLHKQELADMFKKVKNIQKILETKEMNYNKDMNEGRACILEKEEERNKVKDLEESLDPKDDQEILSMSKELEEKLITLKKKEKEIHEIREQLELERIENENITSQLKIALLEAENIKMKQQEKWRKKKEKLRELKIKLETKTTIKENDI